MLDALLTPEDPVPGEITNREHERDQGFSLFILVKRNQSNIFPMALQCPKKCLGVVYIYMSLLDLAVLDLVVHISGSVFYLLGSYITYDEQIYILLVGVGSEVGILAGVLLAIALDI